MPKGGHVQCFILLCQNGIPKLGHKTNSEPAQFLSFSGSQFGSCPSLMRYHLGYLWMLPVVNYCLQSLLWHPIYVQPTGNILQHRDGLPPRTQKTTCDLGVRATCIHTHTFAQSQQYSFLTRGRLSLPPFPHYGQKLSGERGPDRSFHFLPREPHAVDSSVPEKSDLYEIAGKSVVVKLRRGWAGSVYPQKNALKAIF